jgi:hypothetical protein
MKYNKTEILEKIKKNDTGYFYEVYAEDALRSNNGEVVVAYDQSYGDGNEYTICIEFTQLNLFVLLEGTYSSWDEPYWESVNIAMPFTFTETRYKTATIDYIRNQNLNEILGTDDSAFEE